MQRIFLSTFFATTLLFVLGCNRTDQPDRQEPGASESSAADQTLNSPVPEGSPPAEKPADIGFSKSVSVSSEQGQKISQTLDAACAQCMCKMKDVNSCELAVMIEGTSYLVTGEYVEPTELGLCDTAKKAHVVGRLVQYPGQSTIGGQTGEYMAESFRLQNCPLRSVPAIDFIVA
jgi:hypothetical protein